MIGSAEQVGAEEAKPPSSSEESSDLLSPEKSATIESEEKVTEVSSPKGISDESKVTVGQVSNETKTVTIPSVKATEMQLPSPDLLNETAIEETAETLHSRAVHEGKDASFAANKMLSLFRQNRRKFWSHSNKSELKCAWCPSSVEASKNHPAAHQEFGVIKDSRVSNKLVHCGNELTSLASGDNLIQCLECDLVGCRSGFVGGKSHAMLHFLMSGHKYGVSCGESGQLFCMRCGDIVQHECFDREREQVFLEQNHPSLCWQESPINRGINPSSFTVVTKEQGYVWRGLLASYPIPASPQFVRASHFALRRALMFRGCSTSKMVTLGPNALKLTMHRQAHHSKFF